MPTCSQITRLCRGILLFLISLWIAKTVMRRMKPLILLKKSHINRIAKRLNLRVLNDIFWRARINLEMLLGTSWVLLRTYTLRLELHLIYMLHVAKIIKVFLIKRDKTPNKRHRIGITIQRVRFAGFDLI